MNPLALLAMLGTSAGAPPAGALVSKIEGAARALHGFHCKLVDVRTYPSRSNGPPMKIEENLDVTFERPNLFTIDEKESNEPTPVHVVSDGKFAWFSRANNYSKQPIDKTSEEYHWYHNDLLLLLVTGSFNKAFMLPIQPSVASGGDETWNGQDYRILNMELGGGYPIDYKLYVGDDNLVHRIIHTEHPSAGAFIEDFSVTDLQENPFTAKGLFTFTPSPGQKPYDESAFRRLETPLITAGQPAAPFSLPTPAGPRLALQDALAGKRALLLNFWFVQCPPCRAEHPKLEALYREYRDKGFDILSVDDQDTPEAVAKYWKGAGLTFRTVLSGPMAATDPKTGYVDYRGPKLPDYASLVPYGVHECPTNILLNSQGRVVYVSSGWDEAGLRKALEDLDVK